MSIIDPTTKRSELTAMTTTAALSLAIPATPAASAKACTRSVDMASVVAAVSCVVALASFVVTHLVG